MHPGFAKFIDPTSPVFGVASAAAFAALSLVDPARLSPARRRAYRVGLATTTGLWAGLTIDRDRDKNPVVALREIAEQTVRPKNLHESVVQGLQKVLPDEEDEADEIGSLSQSSEAMRLSAAAPSRTTANGDYEG